MTGEVYIHYGADAFDPSHGFPVVNTKYSWAKPHGGLWASRKRASYGWAKWCEENSFRDQRRRTLISVYHAKSGKSSGHS